MMGIADVSSSHSSDTENLKKEELAQDHDQDAKERTTKAKRSKRKGPKQKNDIMDGQELLGNKHSEFNLYIRGLNPDTTDDSLHEMCAKYGPITSAKAITDRKPNGASFCKGYGFVMFEEAGSAAQALEGLSANGVEASYARISPRYPSVPGVVQEDPTNLYFTNLPLTMDEEGLEDLLKPYGQVVSSRILRKENGESRGIGFARMPSRSICLAVIEGLQGKRLDENCDVLNCKFADNPINRRRTTKHPDSGSPEQVSDDERTGPRFDTFQTFPSHMIMGLPMVGGMRRPVNTVIPYTYMPDTPEGFIMPGYSSPVFYGQWPPSPPFMPPVTVHGHMTHAPEMLMTPPLSGSPTVSQPPQDTSNSKVSEITPEAAN
eukprot:m.333071 g.333071  ORF g.333071 m.333071 type:complete len:376 (+) comp17061_c0_seq1:214-1341(+)